MTESESKAVTMTENELVFNGITYVPKVEKDTDTSVGGLRYGIVRSVGDGVCAGYIVAISGPTGQRVTLRKARRLWGWDSRFVLEDLAEYGPTGRFGNKYSAILTKDKEMLEACGVNYCTDAARLGILAIEAEDHTSE